MRTDAPPANDLLVYFCLLEGERLMVGPNHRSKLVGQLLIDAVQPVTLPYPYVWEWPVPVRPAVAPVTDETPTFQPLATIKFRMSRWEYRSRPVYVLDAQYQRVQELDAVTFTLIAEPLRTELKAINREFDRDDD